MAGMKRYMLDTNMVSFLLNERLSVLDRASSVPMEALCISAVTKGEMLFGVARRPGAHALRQAVDEFLLRVDVLPWDSSVAEVYGHLRASLERQGKRLDDVDLMIAAHALSENTVLVTNDQAFRWVAALELEEWTQN
jgi:tRNA(fMet)-specific endonuclease VapC